MTLTIYATFIALMSSLLTARASYKGQDPLFTALLVSLSVFLGAWLAE